MIFFVKPKKVTKNNTQGNTSGYKVIYWDYSKLKRGMDIAKGDYWNGEDNTENCTTVLSLIIHLTIKGTAIN